MKIVHARTEDLHENGGCRGLPREIYATISLYSKFTNTRFHSPAILRLTPLHKQPAYL